MAQLANTPPPLTVDDYLALPDAGPRYQLVDGDFHMAPAPSFFHQIISGNIEDILKTWLKQHPIGTVVHAPLDAFLTETNVYQPDILFISRERSHLIKENGVHGAPDLIVEILSPSTAFLDLGPKKRVYARCGVPELWLVDPVERRVTVYDLRRSDSEPAATWTEADRFRCRFFPGLELNVAAFFAA